MWEQWKKRIERIFFKEVTESEEVPKEPRDINSLHDQDVHTKITYRYPKQNHFRFPVIPDKESQAKQDRKAAGDTSNLDEPAYSRKRNEYEQKAFNQQETSDRSLRPGTSSQRLNSSETANHAASTPKQDEQSKPKPVVNKRPFQPTDVPSPIYGFHNRNQESTDVDVPAFVRKQEERAAMDDTTEHQTDGDSQPIADDVPVQDQSAEAIDEMAATDVISDQNNEEHLPPIKSEPDDVTPLFEDAKEGRIEYSDRVVEQRVETGDTVPNDTRKLTGDASKRQTTYERKSKREQRNTRNQNKQPEQTIPFNVMMSANDKRKYREQKRPEKSPEKQPSAVRRSVPLHLLNDPVPQNQQDQLWVTNQQELLEKTLRYFHVKASVVLATQGPSVTRFEVQPEMGVKVSKIKNLSDDLKLNMAARDIRIEAPIPGKNTVGIEIPNPEAQVVGLQEILTSDAFQQNPSPLTIALGLTIEGTPQVTSIKKMPHGLIAGATGSGKSVCINSILVSLIYKANHRDVKFLLIDPKMVELAPFNQIPHLVSPVITDVKAATQALKWAVQEMEERYEKFVEEGVRDVERYNQKMEKQNRYADKLPFLVIVIDELADLMMVSPQDVEDAICRIAQKARACGIHLLLATQRPSVDVITGLIKANIPTRIAFSVSSQVDSRTIMDTNGAEKLLGNGDMLFMENGAGKSVRLQGAFVSDEEIERVTRYARSLAPTDYLFEQDDLLNQLDHDAADDDDELLAEAITFVAEQNRASTSLLQRHFKIGYNRAARLMDAMEAKEIIAQQNGSKPRDVLISSSSVNMD